MRLLSLDFDPVYGDEATRSSFAHDQSVFDYDVVIWDPKYSLGSYLTGSERYYQGLPTLTETNSVRLQADISRRTIEFAEFLNSGRTLVVVARPPQECQVDTGRRTYSGTGRNRLTTQHVEQVDMLSALPASEVVFHRAKGDRISFEGDNSIAALLRKYRSYLGYEAVVSNQPGSVLAQVAGTDRVLSSMWRSDSGGYLILLPAIDLRPIGEDDEADGDDDVWSDDGPRFQMDLLSAIEKLSGGKVIERPVWASDYATSEQRKLQSDVVKQQARVEAARAKLAKLQQEKESVDARDQLFLGTGRGLELEVKAVLELLGGVATEPEPGRDDWKVAFPEGDAVVEVKGVGKSAAEKHAAQLEKWVAGAMEETGKAPKGILVVNTWREISLGERTESDFPDQMIPYCVSRNHCLVTGLQLFVIRDDVAKDSSKAEFWRRKLVDTAGVVTGCDDWRTVIQESKSDQE